MNSTWAIFLAGGKLSMFFRALMVALCIWTVGANAQTNQGQAAEKAQLEQSPKVQLLLDLLEDQDIQEWAKQQKRESIAPVTTDTTTGSTHLVANRLQAISQHIFDILRALPTLPEEIRKLTQTTKAKTQGYSVAFIIILAVIFIFGGYLAALAFGWATSRHRSKLDQAVVSQPADRFRSMVSEFGYVAGSIVAFSIGSVVLFLIFSLPDLVENIVLQFLFAALASWTVWSVLKFLLKPSAQDNSSLESEQRIIPLNDESARHFTRTLSLAATWFSFGAAIHAMLRQLDMNITASQLIAYGLGIGVVLIGIYAVAKKPPGPQFKIHSEDGKVDRGVFSSWLYVVGFVVLWSLWTLSAMRLFWLLAVVLFLPVAIRASRLAVRNFFHPNAVAENADGEVHSTGADVWAAVVERGLRAALIFGSLVVVAWSWGLVLGDLDRNRDTASYILSSSVSLLIVYVIADLLWQIIKTAIDTTLDRMPNLGEPGAQETVNQAKLRTILPIIRIGAMIVLLTIAIMMGLSSLGVEIGPLIASAGIVGVAVGFGSQALVKDIISGMFYLFDDAFRVGEYIQAGSFKGTVESFSLRSIRLRHHRGPIYTIPFGDLGAVQNLSRDYVIDKITFQVAYDTDLEKARKLIKRAGQELAENPEIGPNIIAPLKMQRVNNFGEYGIEIMIKMTCIPGGQWEVRPKIYPLIKKKFEENGIEFARPTVKVAGGKGDENAAAANTVIKPAMAEPKQ